MRSLTLRRKGEGLWLLVFALVFSAPAAAGEIVDIYGYAVGEDSAYPDNAEALVVFKGLSNRGKVIKLRLRDEVLTRFVALKKRAKRDGVHLSAASAHRGMAQQRRMQRRYPKLAEAPGRSEHHLGTALDFTNVGSHSKAFLWLLQHGFDAGWVPTYYYRRHNKFRREPWHWRYIGAQPAQEFYRHWQKSIRRDIRRLQQAPPKKR